MKNAKLIGKKYQYLCNFIVDRLKRINIEENIEQKYKKSQKNDFTTVLEKLIYISLYKCSIGRIN